MLSNVALGRCCSTTSKNVLRVLLLSRNLSVSASCCKGKGIHKVAVIGGGTMGSGICQMFAQSGIQVAVIDNDEYAQKCFVSIRKSLQTLSEEKFPNEPRSAHKFINDVLSSIQTTQSLDDGLKNADLVVEAVIEDLAVKRHLFKQMDRIAAPHTIFTSNTSSLSIEEIAEVTSRQDRFMGLHFFNPITAMRAVEVIATEKTSPEVVDLISKVIVDVGKVPVKCKENKENAGFIVNSLLYPFLMEAVRLHETGYATIENIDTAMKLGAGLPMGPFELIDLIGIDSVKFVIDRWHAKYPNNPKYFPSPLIDKLAGESKLGQKSGQGFYSYRPKLGLY